MQHISATKARLEESEVALLKNALALGVSHYRALEHEMHTLGHGEAARACGAQANQMAALLRDASAVTIERITVRHS